MSLTAPRTLSAATKPLFITLGIITATPVFALLDPAVLTWTYGVASREPMLIALLQHRGVLQLALGAGLVWAAFQPTARTATALAAITTKTAFLALLLPDPALRAELATFSVWFDAGCVAFFTAFLVTTWLPRARPERHHPCF